MTLHTNLSFETATGSIDYPFTNDYMFRAILQKDKQVLKALIAALLHLKKESIHDVASHHKPNRAWCCDFRQRFYSGYPRQSE